MRKIPNRLLPVGKCAQLGGDKTRSLRPLTWALSSAFVDAALALVLVTLAGGVLLFLLLLHQFADFFFKLLLVLGVHLPVAAVLVPVLARGDDLIAQRLDLFLKVSGKIPGETFVRHQAERLF